MLTRKCEAAQGPRGPRGPWNLPAALSAMAARRRHGRAPGAPYAHDPL